jgi:hypothetical protein
MKKIILSASILGLLATVATAQNADITWQTPTFISGASDVSTLGTYSGSWAPQDGGANTLPVNGVTFQGFSDLSGLTPGATFDNGYSGFASPGTADANYNALLQYARFSNETGPATITWGGMTAGDTYLVQFWVNDARNSTVNARTETLTGGADTSAALDFGAGDTGAGQYIIGTFIADGSGTETLTVTPTGTGQINPSAQVNLLQIRQIAAVPEPSSLALLAGSAGAMIFGLRRKLQGK